MKSPVHIRPTASREIYFDNNATTRPLPEVRKAMMEVLSTDFGNPSSAHYAGERVRERLDTARHCVASLMGTDSSNIYFTSSGTESNNTVLASVLRGTHRPRIITTHIEHSSIPKMCDHLESLGVEVIYLPVNRLGQISLDELERAMTPGASLVSVQWVNNETGVIQSVKEVGDICRRHGVPFHTDGAQAVGKMDIDLTEMPIDFLTFTGHKFHGPQGVGGLYAKDRKWIQPLLFGGSQESGLRPGTENVSGIVGIGKAAEVRFKRIKRIQQKLLDLRNRFEKVILELVPEVEVNGDQAYRICNTTNLLFKHIDGRALVAQLDQMDIRCSQTSACTNARPEPSYVLRGMGLTEDDAYSSVRFSFSEENTFDEVDSVAHQIAEICNRLRVFHRNISQMSSMRG
jgi:cysteine desulfurase